ncbi:MAG TPA: hypothetical protein VEB43_22320 [Anaeromyxobacter sp.]|nr:hypothetical protein [Anaeromyxobacter sp.]
MSRSAATRLLAVALAAAGALACSSVETVRTRAPVPAVREGEWAAIRSQATRRAYLYDRLSHRATATATFLSLPVREARVRRLAAWLGWTEEEKAARLAAERAEAEKYEEFVLALYTSDSRSNDLDAPTSVWRLALKLDDGDLVTRDATAIDADATVMGLFPYVGPFDVVYRVRFPKAPGAPLDYRAFRMELTSALGKVELPFNDGTFGPDRPEGTPLPGR